MAIDIIKELGIESLPAEQQEKLLNKIGTVLYQAIFLRAIDTLSEQEQDALDAFLGAHEDDPQALFSYLQEHVVDFEKIVEQEVARFRAETQSLFGHIA